MSVYGFNCRLETAWTLDTEIDWLQRGNKCSDSIDSGAVQVFIC